MHKNGRRHKILEKKSAFDGIEIDGDGIKTVPNGIKADSPDSEQTVPDFFTPTDNLKQTIPNHDLTGVGHDKSFAALSIEFSL